jgi:hypothetical protein
LNPPMRSHLCRVVLMTALGCAGPPILAVLTPAASPAAAQRASQGQLILAEPTLVDGVLCVERALLHASGLLHECRLAPGAEFLGHRFPSNSWVGYTVSARPHVWLGRDTELQGLVCRGSGWRGWATSLHHDGALRGCFLAAEAVVDGVPCRKASFFTEVLRGSSYLGLHENGRLAECVAARTFTLGGREHRRGERIRLDAEGAPRQRAGPQAAASVGADVH